MERNNFEKQKQSLLKAISSATNVYDLIPLIKSIDFPLDELKQLLSHRVQSSKDKDSINKSYFEGCSMNIVLASDMQQHILSFMGVVGPYETRAVCKNWNRLSQQNERNYLVQVCKTANQLSPIKHDKTNDTLVVVDENKRKALTCVERELGYKGPFVDLQAAVDHAQSKDRLLVYGHIDSGPSQISVWKDLQIVGVGRNVALSHWQLKDIRIGGEWRLLHRSDIVRTHSATVFCTNINMKYPVTVLSEGVLCLNRCSLNRKLSVHKNSELRATGCRFSGGTHSKDSYSCISVEPLARNVTIKESKFEMHATKGYPIWIGGDFSCDYWKMTKEQLENLHVTVSCDANQNKS